MDTSLRWTLHSRSKERFCQLKGGCRTSEALQQHRERAALSPAAARRHSARGRVWRLHFLSEPAGATEAAGAFDRSRKVSTHAGQDRSRRRFARSKTLRIANSKTRRRRSRLSERFCSRGGDRRLVCERAWRLLLAIRGGLRLRDFGGNALRETRHRAQRRWRRNRVHRARTGWLDCESRTTRHRPSGRHIVRRPLTSSTNG